MSSWKDFLRYLDELRGVEEAPTPGAVMFNFVNRYLEPMDGLKYRIEVDGKIVSGTTTKEQHSIEVQPTSLKPIKVYAWSRVKKDFKLIDEVTPVLGKCLLINERMKTFKHDSKTAPHPAPQPMPPSKPNPPSKPPAPPKNSADKSQQPQGVEPVKTKNSNSEPEHQTNRPAGDKIEASQLKKIFPAADETYLEKVANELNRDLGKYKLDTPLRRAHFFAQARQEAGSALSPKQESFNYSTNSLKSGLFKYYKTRHDEADEDGRLEEITIINNKIGNKTKQHKQRHIIRAAAQERIANKVYANRNGNGSFTSADGWRFRGRGIFQLTGSDNYHVFNSAYATYWSDANPDFAKNPDKVVEFPYFIRSAVWFWLHNKIYLTADHGSNDETIDSVTELINGTAKHAAAERRNNFKNLTYPAFK